MKISSFNKLVITGTPLIGEGNVIDNRAFVNNLSRAGIPCTSIYPDGPFVSLARWFHVSMTMNTAKTMGYALNSSTMRSSLRALPLKMELRRSIKNAYAQNQKAACFITSQSVMAEASAGCLDDIPTIVVSSDAAGKLSLRSTPSEIQKKILHLVWNREALDLYKNVLKLRNVHLIKPVDPIDAFNCEAKGPLPFQRSRGHADCCFIKLSGSGGDPKLVHAAVHSLFHKNGVGSIVFPGTMKVQKRLIAITGNDTAFTPCMDTSFFYCRLRELSGENPMLLTYPSEQVKHIALLSENNVYPKVAWLPPRGEHEVMNLAWAIQKGFSGTICVPRQYHRQLRLSLMHSGVRASEFDFVIPESLSTEHFNPSPKWQSEKDAVLFEDIIRAIINDEHGVY